MNEINDDKIVRKDYAGKNLDFEARQNLLGFFSLLLKVAKRNPKLWKQICNENNKNNRGSNNTNKAK